jgi:uncharacterized membrane protein
MTPDEKTLAEAAYTRVQMRRTGSFIMQRVMWFFMIVVFGCNFWRILHDPRTPIQAVFFSVGYGAVIGVILTLFLSQSIQHKQDKKLVRIFEERFPDESSWKQKGKSLLEAEGLA